MVTKDPRSVHDMNVNRKIMALAAGLSALAIIADVPVGLAQGTSPALNIAVVDMPSLMQNSDAAKNALAQIDKMRADYQREIKSKQEEIDRLNQRVAQERSTLSQDVYRQRLKELRQKTANYQLEAQEHQDRLEAALRGASDKVAAAIARIVEEIKKEQNFRLILSRSAVVDTQAVPDITQEILKRLNQRAPTVAVDLPK